MKRTVTFTLAAAASVALLPTLGFAQDAEPAVGVNAATDTVYILNSLLFLVGGFLVFWMAAGFAMLEGGLVRSKNVTMQMTKNIALFSLAAIFYYLLGYNLMYPGDGWSIDGVLGAFGTAGLEPVGVTAADADAYDYASTGSDFFFQLMFCATTASIVSGTLAERIKLWPFLLFTIALTAVIYPVQASWKWGGGFLDAMGFLDFAGSTVVHSVGGWAALVGALILGPRIGKYKDGRTIPMPGSNLTLATLGTFILWLGWFGFNGGSQLAMGTVGDVADISRIFANTNTAAAGGAIAALILTQILYKKPDLTMILNGALAGLVSITAEPLTPSLGAATLIGAIGGIIVVFAVPFLDKLKIDDVVGAIPVHLFCGIWGTIAVVLTNPDASLATQLYSIVVVGLFTVIASGIVWFILKVAMGIRVSEEDEITGLDMAEMGMEAYPEFSKG
ncbi:ammonium transporter [Sulfitobacter pseudonitzschiae]|uniref:Ammonium transporter n=1 Tax=Pseudosulfitobacter pseudonitzschiae TaxID=1402135 RepID=A0A9Q2NQJ8_9RHOB|nr:ammonium transporter [Pseudosulfitobacter pseudonitzschiae]MBM2292437.1 ammonium transporter [Pseudosulfitobacter pseudonitzschiae]MBM2297354.1 ammonium transporter [Pseudosulfitobacter pseudonitzschiae]MBM2302268.1 ammonium transporter [Pseudosulfitobacter pseudonitzschiae]MBM2312051.1 ammonium transporter [Pseudosulfitobacter pseudonitzschiae]MBM2316964.1 ammonium transporter [Pseudosulfitobacter pseudonitzschiae]